MSDVALTIQETVIGLSVSSSGAVALAVTNPVVVLSLGTAGPQGIQGPQGSAVGFTFTQSTPSAVWTINHTLGKHPSIVVIDSANNQCEGIVNYTDLYNLVITFSAAFSGAAYLN